jgi:hypothetical protein
VENQYYWRAAQVLLIFMSILCYISGGGNGHGIL